MVINVTKRTVDQGMKKCFVAGKTKGEIDKKFAKMIYNELLFKFEAQMVTNDVMRSPDISNRLRKAFVNPGLYIKHKSGRFSYEFDVKWLATGITYFKFYNGNEWILNK